MSKRTVEYQVQFLSQARNVWITLPIHKPKTKRQAIYISKNTGIKSYKHRAIKITTEVL